MNQMQRTLRDNNTVRLTVGVILLLAFAAAIAGSAEDYRAARAEMIAAYQAEDFSAMRTAAEKALQARPGYRRRPLQSCLRTGAG